MKSCHEKGIQRFVCKNVGIASGTGEIVQPLYKSGFFSGRDLASLKRVSSLKALSGFGDFLGAMSFLLRLCLRVVDHLPVFNFGIKKAAVLISLLNSPLILK